MKRINLVRALIFIVSVFSLSYFFESGRVIADEQTFSHLWIAMVAGGIFFISLLVMGYGIYVEEKEKNNLKIKFRLYEWIYKKQKAGIAE